MVLAGIGVNHDELHKLALASFGRTSTSFHGSDVASKYYGGEIRTETNSDLVHAALVSEGARYKRRKKDLVHVSVNTKISLF